ncbi:unnamed protein product [Cuscuta epithymum]|uniref:ABC-type xenobiotic transporter n=1 Tax=Cuscuta epithymum TaxID=186058 RepID=A0AAV0GAC8_9ASTE|nr:unnamed protein product [Cuscuta epithymum]
MEGEEKGGIIEPLLHAANISSKPRHSKGKDDTQAPYAKACFFSRLCFSWIGPLISLGKKKILDIDDVPQLAGLDSVRGAFPILRDKLAKENSSSSHDNDDKFKITTFMLVKAIFATAWKEVLLSALFALLYTLANYVGPYLLGTLVQFLSRRQDFDSKKGYFLVLAFFSAKFVGCLSRSHWYYKVPQAGYRARAALVAKVYRKGLTLSSQSKKGRTSGEIINFMAVDANSIRNLWFFVHDCWLIFVQLGLAMAILYKNLGLSCIATLIATVGLGLLNFAIGISQQKFQEKVMGSKDERMNVTSEALRNMRLFKLQSWEAQFLSRIMEHRKEEAGWLKKYMYYSSLSEFISWNGPTLVSVTTFMACRLMGTSLDSAKILSALAVFRILQEPINELPYTISMLVQIRVSLDRIAAFLSLDDMARDAVEKLPRGSSGNTAIEIIDGTFTWDNNVESPFLREINVAASHGMRVAVCGSVGSGKSSLLSCILGEMVKVSGMVKVCGTMAYVAQSPWIQSGTIEENILFGKEMDREMYGRILEGCALSKDLEILSYGDQTIVGERGINLSGGQKQRIQIARALYQDADIYLLDDPFSAVDAHTGNHLFKECLLHFLQSKTVIYVTHQVEFLPDADLILVMNGGKITQVGKYNEIAKSGSDFMNLVGAHRTALSKFEGITEDCNDLRRNVEIDVNKLKSTREDENKIYGQEGQLVQEEEREKGGVGFPVYWKYLTLAYRGWLVPLILLAEILFQLLQIGSNYWMTWATPVSDDVSPPVKGFVLIFVYVALALGSSFCNLARALLLVTAAYKTAQLLFYKMHSAIFRAPMSFFDSTPSGRILNRASTDQNKVDLSLASDVGAVAFSVVQILGVVAVMSQVSCAVLIVFIIILVIGIGLQRYYIGSARELSRLSGVRKAPLVQHFAETISGATTIRSFGQEARFMDTSMDLIDSYSRPLFYYTAASRWLDVRLDALSLVLFTSSLVFLIYIPEGTIDPSIAGLAVTYGLNLSMLQNLLIWYACQMENEMISVERMLQYICIPSEPPQVIESNRPDPHWPTQGEINICNLQVRYAPHMPFVLRGVTCTLFGGKKTGIVGRTGSGKSTLIQTLFRIIEPTTGQIFIDGIDICSIGLHDLRSRLSIIPQDPTMFMGTVRGNLDPLGEYTDEQIWEAIDKCQLGDEVRKRECKLDSAVVENGENWSVGQRQLMCLGRVLLNKRKVLVLDEATASVDTISDNLIQQIVNQHFSGSTVITIAHRITSVVESDMVLLLDHGLVLEYDSPKRLLQDKSSLFSKLVSEYTMR